MWIDLFKAVLHGEQRKIHGLQRDHLLLPERGLLCVLILRLRPPLCLIGIFIHGFGDGGGIFHQPICTCVADITEK